MRAFIKILILIICIGVLINLIFFPIIKILEFFSSKYGEETSFCFLIIITILVYAISRIMKKTEK